MAKIPALQKLTHICNSTLCIIIRKRAIEARMQCTHCLYSMQCNQIVLTDISIIVIASQQIPTIKIIVSSIIKVVHQ